MGQKGKPQNVNHGGYRGVATRPLKNGEMRYRAALVLNGKRKHGPHRLTKREAAKDYDGIAFAHYGEDAILNFPKSRP